MEELKNKINGSVSDGGFERAVLSGCFDKSIKRITYKPVVISGKTAVNIETLTADGKALHENVPADAAAEKLTLSLKDFRQLNVFCRDFSAEVLHGKKGAVHIKYKEGSGKNADIGKNDRKKNYLLDPGKKYDFLVALGVQDQAGRVKDKRQSKFRQINRFTEILEDVVPSLPSGDLTVWDLCCGKSYLSFAVYYYFTFVLRRNIKIYCVDRKADVIAECSDVAKKCGFDGMEFICGDIFKCLPDAAPDMVLSLHACDTATDMVLSVAVTKGARVILSSPCCQHELAGQIDCPDLYFITKEPVLKQKLAALITDALRCKLLYASGYKVTALEFIDPDETPKNLLIRAERSLIPEKYRRQAKEEYDGLCKRLGAEPTMKRLLEEQIQF